MDTIFPSLCPRARPPSNPIKGSSGGFISAAECTMDLSSLTKMEEFSNALHRQTGVVLTPQQIMKLYSHYYDVDTKLIDYQRFYADVLDKAIVKARETLEKEEISSYDKIICKISSCLEKKLNNDFGRDRLKQAYRLVSESRSPVITRLQLKTACLTRLSCPLQDFEIECVFKKLDNLRVGSIRTSAFIEAILSKIPVPQKVSISTEEPEAARKVEQPIGSEAARITYDHKYVNLHAPDPAVCPLYSVWDLENIVRTKITETATASNNMLKTARKLFGDGGHSSGDLEISRDQLRYTFWKVLRVDVADRDLDRLFQKYQRSEVIMLSALMEGIIKKAAVEEPMLEDLTMTNAMRTTVETKIHQNNSLDAFFTQLRHHINDLINRESRAPHYLLHGTSRVTADQAKLFFRKKLLFDIDRFSPELIAQVMQAYTSNGLIDLKRIFMEAMATKDTDDGSTQPALLNAGTVRATCLPEVLKHMQAQHSPEYIENMIVSKCCERMVHGPAHNSLYKFFRDRSDHPRFLSRKNMLQILHMFDILIDKKAFEGFFAKHECGSGSIDILEFLKRLFPVQDLEPNAFAPVEGSYAPRPNLDFQEILSARPTSTSLSAAPDRHRSVEDLLDRLRQKREALEAVTYEYPSPRSATSSPRPASAAAILSRNTQPAVAPALVNGFNPFHASPSPPQSERGRSVQSSRPSTRGRSPGEARAWSPARGQTVGFFVPTLDLFSTPHAELALHSARRVSPDVQSVARPTSAPAGGTLHSGARLAQTRPPSAGSRSRKRGSSGAADDLGIQDLRVSALSPRAPALTLAMPEPVLFDEALQDIMQSSLQKALLELTDSPRTSPVQSPNPASDRPQSRSSRPVSASATMRPRSARDHNRASAAREKSRERDSAFGTDLFAPKGYTIPEATVPMVAMVNTEPIVLVTQMKQQLRVQRPSSAPSSRTKGSPRSQKMSPSSIATSSASPPTESVLNAPEPRVPVLVMPKLEETDRKQRPKTSSRSERSVRRPTRPAEAPARVRYVLDPNYVDASDSLVFPESPRLTAPSPSPSPRSARSTRTADSAATFISVSTSTKSPVYTGQARTNRVDPTSPHLSNQYRLYKNYSRTSNNEYGMFSTHYLKAVRKNNRLFEKQIRNGSPISVQGQVK